MKAEIDQSGKVERLNTHTIISIANHSSGSVYISSGEKIKLVKILRKSIVSRKDLVHVVFSTLIFILMTKYGNNLSEIIIDEEYTNKEDVIMESITKLYHRNNIKKWPNIRFGRVGKKSPAHILAWGIHRHKKKKSAIVLKAEDVIKCWKI